MLVTAPDEGVEISLLVAVVLVAAFCARFRRFFSSSSNPGTVIAKGRSWSFWLRRTPPTGEMFLEVNVPSVLLAVWRCCAVRSSDMLRPSFGERERLCRSMTWARGSDWGWGVRGAGEAGPRVVGMPGLGCGLWGGEVMDVVLGGCIWAGAVAGVLYELRF